MRTVNTLEICVSRVRNLFGDCIIKRPSGVELLLRCRYLFPEHRVGTRVVENIRQCFLAVSLSCGIPACPRAQVVGQKIELQPE